MFIGIAVLAAIAVVLGIAARKPSQFRIERSNSIRAKPAAILALVNDFKAWPAWSPYEKLDPAMKKTFSGTRMGKGAIYEWEGNSKAGKGRMEIVDTTPTKTIIKLDFERPFKANNTSEFLVVPDGGPAATKVTWAMYGTSPFQIKVMEIFVNMDKIVGKDFEAGLASMKQVAES